MGPTGQGCPPSSGQVDLGSRVLNKRPPGQLMAQVAVSIHTPASGATRQFQHYATFVLVSIQAPTWGTTQKFPAPRHESFRFNPRARVGRDSRSARLASTIGWFQSTRPHGARPHESLGSRAASVPFQSARPRGTRLRAHQACPGGCSSFNPRARVGRDGLIITH